MCAARLIDRLFFQRAVSTGAEEQRGNDPRNISLFEHGQEDRSTAVHAETTYGRDSLCQCRLQTTIAVVGWPMWNVEQKVLVLARAWPVRLCIL